MGDGIMDIKDVIETIGLTSSLCGLFSLGAEGASLLDHALVY